MKIYKKCSRHGEDFCSLVCQTHSLIYKIGEKTVAPGSSLLFCFLNPEIANEIYPGYRLVECETDDAPILIKKCCISLQLSYINLEKFWSSPNSYYDDRTNAPPESYGVKSLIPIRIL